MEEAVQRQFIRSSVGTALGVVSASNLPGRPGAERAMTGTKAETIFRDGTIITMDDKRPQVDAVAVGEAPIPGIRAVETLNEGERVYRRTTA